MVEQQVHQLVDGGSSPTSSLQIKSYRIEQTTWAAVRKLFGQYHYRKEAMGGSIKFVLGLYSHTALIGASVLGDPRHRDKYGGKAVAIEIRRLACIEEAPPNTESYFIGRIIWWLRKNSTYSKILSYADLSVGHQGTIYKAANFQLIGQTSATSKVVFQGREYHPRSLTINRPYARKLAAAVTAGEAHLVKGKPKNIFTYEIKR